MIHYTANDPNRADGSGGIPDDRPFGLQPYARINIGGKAALLVENDLSLSSVERAAIVRDALSPALYNQSGNPDIETPGKERA